MDFCLVASLVLTLAADNSARVGKELQFAITVATTMECDSPPAPTRLLLSSLLRVLPDLPLPSLPFRHLVQTAEVDLRSATSSASNAAEAVHEIKAQAKDTTGLAQAGMTRAADLLGWSTCDPALVSSGPPPPLPFQPRSCTGASWSAQRICQGAPPRLSPPQRR